MAICVIFILVAGLRYHIGGDSIRYEENYSNIPVLNDLFEQKNWWLNFEYQPLWIVFASVCRTITPDFAFLQFVHACIVNWVIFYYGSKYCRNKFAFILLYFITNYVYFNFEILRESFAVILFIISYKYLINKAYLKYYAVCFLAFLFHASAIILFFLPILYPLLSRLKGMKSYLITASIGLLISLIIQESFQYIVGNSVFNLLVFQKLGNVLEAGKLNIYGIIVKIFFLIPVFLTAQYIHVKYKNEDIRPYTFIISSFLLFSTIGLVFQPLLRWTNYFVLFELFIFTDFVFSIKRTATWKSGSIIALLIFLANSFVYYNSYPYMASINGDNTTIKKYQLYYPYYTIIDKKQDPDREYLVHHEF